jgi:hypothetical protein
LLVVGVSKPQNGSQENVCLTRTVSGDMAMSDEQRASGKHCREIADKIRQLARQSDNPQIREELFDLADQLDRMAGLFEGGGLGTVGK